MVMTKRVVQARVANTVGVALAPTSRNASTATLQQIKRPSTPIPPHVRPLNRVRITKERGDLTKSGYIYKAMTNLGEKASQLNYNVVQQGPRGEAIIQKVTNKQTTPEGEISGTVPELVYPTVPSKIQVSKNLMVYDRPVRVQKVYIKWEEQQIGEDTYAKGRSPGYFVSPRALPKPLPPIIPPPVATPLPEAQNIRATVLRPNSVRLEWDGVRMPGIAYKIWLDGVAKGTAVRVPMLDLAGLTPGKRYKVEIRTQPYSKSDPRSPSKKVTYYFTTQVMQEDEPHTPPVTPPYTPPAHIQPVPYRGERAAKIARSSKRKLSAHVEELIKKRGFPRAVKEAIEKGLERKDAPANIERMIEKVAKINTPDYFLRRTIAKRIARDGAVQYKVDTDKGTIVYENADEKDTNAILGMPTPTGEVIPLQIKVIR